MREEIFRDWRVILLVVCVLLALSFIYLIPPSHSIDGNLKYGLDIRGGSWLQLELQSVLVKIDANKEEIIKKEVSDLLGVPVTIVSSDEESVTIRAENLSKEKIDFLGYGQSETISNNTVKINTADKTAIINFLSKHLHAEVVPARYNGMDVFEIRGKITQKQLEDLLSEVNGKISLDENGNPIFIEGVTPETMEITRDILSDKLNMIGLKDIQVRTVGEKFILIDMPGVDISTATKIIGKPGKFEVRIQTEPGEIKKGKSLSEILNITEHVFFGGEAIASVSTMPRRTGMNESAPWGASFRLNDEGARTLRNACIKYGAVDDPKSHELVMLLDNKVVYSAPLAEDLADLLRERPVYDLIASTGTGDAGHEEAKELIVHLKAGALPVNVEIIGSGEVPPSLGEGFKVQAVIAGLLALLVVGLVIYLRYRVKKIVLPMLCTSLSEVIMLLGFASAIGWQLDLASIAGIIAVIGTGVDHLIVITDEVLYEGRIPPARVFLSRIAGAFKIIFAAAATTVIAMTPLVWMGFGALKGFAIITIVGVLIGVLIARPAYGRIIQYL
ncbi:MAG: preprotein translocase subunit SecD [Candidatus Syntropharchaeia archaeon]